MKRLQKSKIEKSRFFNVFANTRRKNQFFQFSIFINLFFIYNIVIIIVNEFINNKKKLINFFYLTNLSTNSIANLFFSINC